jgi:hypothetical protein
MFKEKILAELKKQGLSEKLIKFITVTEESEIEGAVSELKGLFPTTLEDVLKNETLKAQLDAKLQVEGDKRATQAVATHDKKLKDQYDLVEKGKSKDLDKKDEPKGVEKELQELKAILSGLVTEKQRGTKQEQISAKLKAKGVKGNYAELLLNVPDEEIDARVEALKAQELSLIQSQTDEWVKNGGKPPKSADPDGGVADLAAKTKEIVAGYKEKTAGNIQKI